MNKTINSACLFLGGMLIGASAAFFVMRKMGFHRDGYPGDPLYDEELDSKEAKEEEHRYLEERENLGKDVRSTVEKPSFTNPKKVNTEKVRYSTFRENPAPEEVIRHLAEREHPTEEDSGGDDDESGISDFPPDDDWEGQIEAEKERKETEARLEAEYQARMASGGIEIDPMYDPTQEIPLPTEEELEEDEISEAMMLEMDYHESDGYGHVLSELTTHRKDRLVYLVPSAYCGEIYPVESLTYYARDNVLCDATDMPVEDVVGVVGNALEEFGYEKEYPDMVWVRNCSLGFEYEITQVDSYYGAHLYGVTDEEFEGGGMSSLPRKASRRKSTAQEDD